MVVNEKLFLYPLENLDELIFFDLGIPLIQLRGVFI